jgi:hypothetical protein
MIQVEGETMKKCGCRYGGNQYGHYYRFCEQHGEVFLMAAKKEGVSPEELLECVLTEYLNKLGAQS